MESTCTLTASKRILMVSKFILTASIAILMTFTEAVRVLAESL